MTLRLAYWCLAICVVLGLTSSAVAQNHPSRSRRASLAKISTGTPQPLSAATLSRLASVDTVGVGWFDDMESPGLWTADGFWHQQLLPDQIRVLNPDINPRLVTLPDNGFLPAAHSGNGVWWFGEAATGTFIGSDFDTTQAGKSGGESMNPQQGAIISPPINLKGISRALLGFWTWWEIEAFESHSYDLMHVDVSKDNGVTWDSLGGGTLNPVDNLYGLDYVAYSSGGFGLPGQWVQQLFDLTRYSNSVVVIRFWFNSVDASYNGFRGWLIDDVSVTGDSVGAPVLASLSPRVVVPGQSITIAGSNFTNGATVSVDKYVLSADSTSVQGVNRLEFRAPDQPGIHAIMVTNPDGKSSNILFRALTISTSLPPSITAIIPDSALAGVPTPFTLTGGNFVQGAQVFIGGLPATGVTVVTAATIFGAAPFGLSPGAYNVEIVNPDSLRAILPLGFRVLKNGIVVMPLGDQQVGHPQPIRINPPGGQSTFTTGKLYFRPGGLAAYDSLTLKSDTAGFLVDFPASVITPRGVEYWVSLRSLSGASMTFPEFNPAFSPAVFPTTMPVLTAPLTLVPGSYRMIAASVILAHPSPLIQLGDDFGPYQDNSWRLFRWENNRYREFPATETGMLPGNGFWLVTAGATTFDFRNAVSVPTVSDFIVPVDTGWNQIGNPFAFPILWQNSQPINCYVSGPYLYDGVQYQIGTTLKPFTAAFVYNYGPSPGLISFLPKDASLGNLVGKGEVLASGEFFVRLGASVEGTPYSDSYNRVGFKQAATSSVDRLDAPKPPAIGNGVELSIMENQVPYLEDFKPLNSDGQSWIFAVRGRGIEGKARVSFEQTGTLPPGFEIHILDLLGQNAVPVSGGGFAAALLPEGRMHYYKIIVGSAAFAQSQGQGIPLEPVSFALHQNYPNPFNPGTRISYDLGTLSDVTLEIYSSLGQLVRTLVRGQQTTGSYVSSWDGRSDAGMSVASGVYLARLRAGEFTAVRKIMLIR